MRTILIALLFAISLQAADFTVTVTIPDNKSADVAALISAWRARQLNPDGTPRYPSNAALGRSILADAIQRILRDQCEAAPASCPAWLKTHVDQKAQSDAAITTEIQDAVRP
jgi:hypothetical protein